MAFQPQHISEGQPEVVTKIELDGLKAEPTRSDAEADDTGSVPAVREGRIAEMTARYFLSAREVDILTLLVAGRNGPYIAEHLCVSDNTVKTHIRHIYTKARRPQPPGTARPGAVPGKLAGATSSGAAAT